MTGDPGGQFIETVRAGGVQVRFLMGVFGVSGSSTVKLRSNGHGVFSNCRILSNTSRSLCAVRISSSLPTGTSILQ